MFFQAELIGHGLIIKLEKKFLLVKFCHHESQTQYTTTYSVAQIFGEIIQSRYISIINCFIKLKGIYRLNQRLFASQFPIFFTAFSHCSRFSSSNEKFEILYF